MRLLLLVLCLLGMCGALAAAEARAIGATFSVDSVADTHDAQPGDGVCADVDGNCTLRAAVEEADALAGADSIDVPSNTYVLTLGELEVTSSDGVTLTGADVSNTTISAGGSNVFLPGQGASRLLELAAGAQASLSSLELTNGGDNFGGAILNAGQLALDGVALDSNQASNYGGAVDQTGGSLTVTDSTVESNVAHGNFGGGIAIDGGTATITGSAVDSNEVGFAGGGIYNNGTLSLTDTTVSTNSATGTNEGAGGIESPGALTITGGSVDGNTTKGHGGGVHVATTADIGGVEISGNTAGDGGGIVNDGTLTLHEASVDGNHAQAAGNGLAGGVDDEGTLTLSNSSITDNTSDGSVGGLLDDDTASLTNVTLSGNTASDTGGILDLGSLTLVSSTLADNGPDGLDSSGSADLTDTIVAKQRSGADCTGTITSHGHNLDSDGTCSLTAAGDLAGVDPLLAPLADNGGPGKTQAPQAGSPAIDAGDGSACPATDERGVSRSGVCDIGAVEYTPPAPPPTTSTTTTPPPPPTTTTTTTPPPPPTNADLSIGGAFLPGSAKPSSPVALDLTISNAGPATASSVTVSITLPQSLGVVSAPPGCTTTSAGETCVVGTLASGAQASLDFTLESPADGSAASVTASVGAAEADPATSNNSVTLELGRGCATQLTLDSVTVLADCIEDQTDGTLVAAGHVRFTDGAAIDVPLVIDPPAHTISTQGGANGTLSAGGRAVASGPLVVHTKSVGEPTTGLDAAAISGVTHVAVALSGWPFLDDLASTGGLYLLRGAGSGALVVGKLQLPAWTLTSLSDTIAVQVDAQGRRSIRSQGGHFDLPQFNLPFTNWKLASLDLQFLDGGDAFSGKSVFQTSYWGRSSIGPVVISHGKLQSFQLFWDARACDSCSVNDPTVGPDTFGSTLADLRYVSASGINLAKIPYTQTKIVTPCASLTSASACAPPQLAGAMEAGFYDDTIIADVNFQYFLSGALNASGHVYVIPIWPPNVPTPNWAQGNAGFQNVAKKGIDIATAYLQYTPPDRVVVGGTYDVVGDFLVGNASIGFDPPHFTGEGGFTLKVPSESPVFAGKKIAGVEALISDKAAAAQADLKVCIQYIGCAKTFLGVAYEWNGHWVFGEPVENFRTVSTAEGGRLLADAKRGPLAIPHGWKLAVVKVQSVTGVPNVELTSPSGRIAVSRRTSSRIGNGTGALVSASAGRHEETFLLALPERGRWHVKRLGGPAVRSVELGRGLVRPTVVPQSRLPVHSRTNRAIRLRWRTKNAWPGASVDLWAGTTRGAGGMLIASGLPASGSTVWRPGGLQSGRYFVWAVLNRDGVPGESAFWRGRVDLVGVGTPRPPAHVSVRRTHGLVVVSWRRVAGASTYAVVADSAHGRPIEVDTPATEAVLPLRHGRRYAVTIRSVSGNGLQGAATRAKRVRG